MWHNLAAATPSSICFTVVSIVKVPADLQERPETLSNEMKKVLFERDEIPGQIGQRASLIKPARIETGLH